MRRLTVMQLLPALDSGGVERSTLEIGDALVRSGHRSLVVSAGGRLCRTLESQGSEHFALPLGRKSLRTLWQVRALRRLIAEQRPDIVHARSRLPAWIAWWALRGLPGPRPRFVTTVHGLNSPGRYSGILTRGERVICVSNTVREHVLAHWPQTDPRKLAVIERGIDPRAFPRSSDEKADLPPTLAGGRVLLLPGRGTRLKGHADALRLIADLRARGHDARLWLLGAREVGREAYIAELQALALSLGIADVVEISAPRADIARAYASAEFVLQLSRKPEAFGRTVLEALSVGRPVLAWSHGGVGELLGRYFPEGGVTPFVEAELALRADAWLRAPPAVSARLDDSLARMQASTLELYDAVFAA